MHCDMEPKFFRRKKSIPKNWSCFYSEKLNQRIRVRAALPQLPEPSDENYHLYEGVTYTNPTFQDGVTSSFGTCNQIYSEPSYR